MRMYDIILKKRNGAELSTKEIEYFVDYYTRGMIPDYQVSALLMAILFQRMNNRETIDLTMAMVRSGEIIDLSGIEGIKVDKHSTGGVGDTTTLVLGPMVASLGIPFAKMSGRGLGHTGGTIDKLESFDGFSAEMSSITFLKNVNNIKISVCGQTGELVPADKKLYALRDVTATIENISLIASSIMSKKLASGADAIILDVKVGDGAFMKNIESAIDLAKMMVDIGRGVGKKTVAVISDMDQPLGCAVGNILEVKEAIETLKGKGPEDLLELALILGANMVVLAGKSRNLDEAKIMLKDTISSGKALAKLKEFITTQGGSVECIDNMEKFPKAKYIVPVFSNRKGIVKRVMAESIGLIAMELGAGRKTKESIIDLTVGLILNKKRGDQVAEGDILAFIHSNDESKIITASNKIIDSFVICEKYDDRIPLIYEIIK